MKYSEPMDKIAPALLAVQKQIAPVVKDSTNPHFKNRYASLDSMTEYVRPLLAAENLVLVQGATASEVTGDHFFVDVVTTIIHESGQLVESTMRMPLDKSNPQGAGSAMTYGRRYGLAAMLAISTEEDDDAEAAVRRVRSVAEQTGHAPAKVRQARPEPRLPNETEADVQGYNEQGPACPKCGSDMWDNRLTKKNPKAPDYKCKDRSCDGVIWPEKKGEKKSVQQAVLPLGEEPPPPDDDDMPY
jgi:hypothetical protein